MSSPTVPRHRSRNGATRPAALRPPAPAHRPGPGTTPDQADGDRVHELEVEVEQLRAAMASRAVIEQAKGVLMLLTGCGEQGAFDLLTHISSHTHRKVRDVAHELTSSAGGHCPLPDDIRAILRDACPPKGSPG